MPFNRKKKWRKFKLNRFQNKSGKDKKLRIILLCLIFFEETAYLLYNSSVSVFPWITYQEYEESSKVSDLPEADSVMSGWQIRLKDGTVSFFKIDQSSKLQETER